MTTHPTETLGDDLTTLKLDFIAEHYQALEKEALEQGWLPRDYLSKLVTGQVQWKQDRMIERYIKQAHFPVIKTLDQFSWSWPKKINRGQIDYLFALDFIEQKGNVVFIGPVGVGKTHLASALGYHACQRGYRVLYSNVIELINNLNLAAKKNKLKEYIRNYVRPDVLILDELGYLPIDKHGADLLFQVVSARYETASIILTSNKAYNEWMSIFNNDSVFASAMLDRLLHHCDTVLIEGDSYRMKDNSKPNSLTEES